MSVLGPLDAPDPAALAEAGGALPLDDWLA